MDVVPDELLQPFLNHALFEVDVWVQKIIHMVLKQIHLLYSWLNSNCLLYRVERQNRVKCLDTSTIYLPTVCPGEVPAVLGISEILCWLAK
jgi:hypothetical protein